VPSGGLDTRTSGYRARDEGDCLVLDGKAGFASMSDAATYVIVGGLVEGGNPADPSFVLALPRLDSPGVVNHHNWSAMGMRATASHDIECVGLRVPKSEALVAPLSLVRMVQAAQSVEVLQRRSWGALGILGLWLGLAQAAFDFTVEYLGKRYGFLAGAGLLAPETGLRADEGWAQSALGHMEHWLETGRIVLDDTLRRLETPFPSVQAFTRHIVRTVYHLRRMTEEVALGAMKLCGAHAYVTDRPMERIYRDLTGAIVMAWKTDQLQHMLGLGALGRPITFAGPAGS
jgi:alkylation response protein AidB-like acyl-CoA dehydrogenase